LLACLGLSSALPARVSASPNFVQDQIKQHTSGFSEKEIAIFLDVPEIAENGNQVKVSFEIESPMSKDDFVKEVYIFADGNPAPNVAKFEFSPFSGECFAATKMRLSKTQNIYLLAKFNDNKFALEKSAVKVTIGGCGG
jgi:sulfur-oxidizing protein SoxY